MNNLVLTVKKFLKNKNVVTVLGVVLIMAIIYFGYTEQIKSQVSPVSVPVASRDIQPGTLITSDDVQWISVPRVGVSSTVVRAQASIVGKYSNVNAFIPAGSMFYSSVLVDAKDLADASITQVKEGEVPYNFAVTMNSTYGNSIMPGSYIDIYMKAENDAGQVMVGKLVENVEVLAVKDSRGNNVFENTSEDRTPAYLIFGVEEEIHILLRKAEYMSDYSIVLFPVPHGQETEDTIGNTRVSTQYLQEFINSKTVNIPLENNGGTTNGGTGGTTNQGTIVGE